MRFAALLAFLGALLCGSLACGVLSKQPRTLVRWAFVLGMLTLALRQVMVGWAAQASSLPTTLYWLQLSWVLTTVLPGSWLLFSLSFARSNAHDFLVRWKWGVVGAVVLPLLVIAVFRQTFFLPTPVVDSLGMPLVTLGLPGAVVCVFSLLIAVLILVNLEASLRASTGRKRWQIKFMLLGVGSIFAVYIYTMNQTMLFATITPALQTMDSLAVVFASILIGVALARHRLGYTQLALSPTMLASSVTIVLVGSYLLVVGVLAKLIGALGSQQLLPLGSFFVFAALLSLAVVLLSDQRRQRFKRFLSRHIYGMRHDYRQGWMTFNERTTSVVDIRELCTVVTRIVAETFVVPEVTIWLWQEEGARKVRLGGSTVFSEHQTSPPGLTEQEVTELFAYVQQHPFPMDLAAAPDARGEELWQTLAVGCQQAAIRYAVPLMAGRECLGVMTVHGQWSAEPFTLEDRNLLKIMADQTATSLFNLRLSQRLAQAQQRAALQTLSVFFVHDLKNLASNLSMTLQNLPIHYHNPAFRDDLLRLIADSVARLDSMRSRLSLLTQPLELHCTDTDLNELIGTTLSNLRPSFTVPLVTNLQPLPALSIDPEHIEKVLVNLLVNAQEAMPCGGEIRVATELMSGWAVLTVHDRGCGMSPEFIEEGLFQPFRTTKRLGSGIGLFQCKMIVEAHQGRIEVESEEGKGTTFRVLLRC